MDDVVAVEVLEGEYDAADEELRDVFWEAVAASDLEPQIAAGHVVHDEIEVEPVLEGVDHVDDEGVLEAGEQLALVEHRFDALLGYYAESGIPYTVFDISFIAYTARVRFCSTRYTLPKPPLPRISTTVNWSFARAGWLAGPRCFSLKSM